MWLWVGSLAHDEAIVAKSLWYRLRNTISALWMPKPEPRQHKWRTQIRADTDTTMDANAIYSAGEDDDGAGHFEHWAGGMFPGNIVARGIGRQIDDD